MNIKILIVKTVSDWFEDEWVEINAIKYTYFVLKACELRWDLIGYYPGKTFGTMQYDTFNLSPMFNVKGLIDKIEIREIIGNQYKQPKDLLAK